MSEALEAAAAALAKRYHGEDLGSIVKFDLVGEGVIRIVGGKVVTGDGEADVTISAPLEVFRAIFDGEMSPATAYMSGKIEVDGDMGVAMMLSQALGKLFALAEAYPDLKANQNFIQLQNELSAIEDKVAASRRFYNSAVGDYNTSIEQFPNSVIAGMGGFDAREFFDVGEEARVGLNQPPEVKF